MALVSIIDPKFVGPVDSINGFTVGGVPLSLVGGSDTQVQFNDSGVLEGDADFLWNKATKKLSVGDVVGDANGLTMILDDANNNFMIEGVLNAGYTDSFSIAAAPDGNPIPGTAIFHSKDATNDASVFFVGNGTNLGLPDMAIFLAYMDDADVESASFIIGPEGLQAGKDSALGGLSGTDTITAGFGVENDMISSLYQNLTTSELFRVILGGSSDESLIEYASPNVNAQSSFTSIRSRMRFQDSSNDDAEINLTSALATIQTNNSADTVVSKIEVTPANITLSPDSTGAVLISSGSTLAGVGTGANGIKIKNPKNAAASALSGTQLDVEIDIGGTPYHFTVYPTKA